VTVDVLAQNKVGIGEAARKTVLPNIDSELCTSSSVVAAPSSVYMFLNSTVTMTVIPALQPGLKEVSPTANKNRILIYGIIIILEVHKLFCL
jgi:hypothetical protein